jgi:hypothetical protein
MDLRICASSDAFMGWNTHRFFCYRKVSPEDTPLDEVEGDM